MCATSCKRSQEVVASADGTCGAEVSGVNEDVLDRRRKSPTTAMPRLGVVDRQHTRSALSEAEV